MSTEYHLRHTRGLRGLDHTGGEPGSHQLAGERERIAFHAHQFNHGCFGDHCPEADRLYATWLAVLRSSRRPPEDITCSER